MSPIIAVITAAVRPFADLYAVSPALQSGTAFLHFAGLLTAGGFAVATDRAVWRTARSRDVQRRRVLISELEAIHRPVLIGLSVVFATGIALTAADTETYLASPVFWSKMLLIVLLLANGWWLGRISTSLVRNFERENRGWRLLLASSAISITLWLAVTLAGVLLTNNA